MTANEVRGGPNSDYSLAEARGNFKRYLVMYAPGRDQRMSGPDSALELETKRELVAAFERLGRVDAPHLAAVSLQIQRLEQVLRDELSRRVRESSARPKRPDTQA
jgi:hypothetical protein